MEEITITLRITQDKKNKIDNFCKSKGFKKSEFYRTLIDRFLTIQEEQEKELNEKIKKVFYDTH